MQSKVAEHNWALMVRIIVFSFYFESVLWCRRKRFEQRFLFLLHEIHDLVDVKPLCVSVCRRRPLCPWVMQQSSRHMSLMAQTSRAALFPINGCEEDADGWGVTAPFWTFSSLFFLIYKFVFVWKSVSPVLSVWWSMAETSWDSSWLVWTAALTSSVVWKLRLWKHTLSHTHAHTHIKIITQPLASLAETRQVIVVVFSSSFDHLYVGPIFWNNSSKTLKTIDRNMLFFFSPVVLTWFVVVFFFPF